MQEEKDTESSARPTIDWQDVTFAVGLGAAFAGVKIFKGMHPEWQITLTTINELASMQCVGYILVRARRSPVKLDQWGITTPLSAAALLTAGGMMLLMLFMLILGARQLHGEIDFKPAYITQMVEYIPAAFPQQFAMCSIGLVSLATLPIFRGNWRLPLAVGFFFSLAHFWAPARIPGTQFPIQMFLTFPAGTLAAWYFVRFRNILPLTAIHAISYPLMHSWIEAKL